MPPLDFMPYELRYKYPHMAPADKAIWERFIVANPSAFDSVAYDVPVGIGTDMDTVVNPETGGDINKLYQRKIDVVAVKDGKLFVVELKPRASTAALGQVQGYVVLFKRDYQVGVPVNPVVITDELLPDMEFLAKDAKVNLVVV